VILQNGVDSKHHRKFKLDKRVSYLWLWLVTCDLWSCTMEWIQNTTWSSNSSKELVICGCDLWPVILKNGVDSKHHRKFKLDKAPTNERGIMGHKPQLLKHALTSNKKEHNPTTVKSCCGLSTILQVHISRLCAQTLYTWRTAGKWAIRTHFLQGKATCLRLTHGTEQSQFQACFCTKGLHRVC